jgi:Transposase IS200 like
MEYRSNRNIVFSCKYHVVFCPKYRRPVPVNGVDRRLKQIIAEVAEETDTVLLETEVMADHVSSQDHPRSTPSSSALSPQESLERHKVDAKTLSHDLETAVGSVATFPVGGKPRHQQTYRSRCDEMRAGICLEDLTGIRGRTIVSKAVRRDHSAARRLQLVIARSFIAPYE